MTDQTLTPINAAVAPLRMPGATLVTRLKVYDTETPDGQYGGTPHFHFMCTEMYFVVAGSGHVELIDHNGFSRVDLYPHSALIFSPGTIHRLINPNRDLELLVVMQNSGLPERGDNVVCFGEEWMADDAKFAEAMKVSSFEEAYVRRDRGVEGFLQIKAAFERGEEEGRQALQHFYDLAADRTRNLRANWRSIVENGAQAEVNASLDHLAALDAGSTDFLANSQQYLIHAGEYNKPGFCGKLNRYFDPATLSPEGVKQ
ncbi:MAG: cupin domain-containing protein [Anaerolineae bacterium]|nr:cupin domain-containing protein [Anaerolineae bacterium]